MVTSKFEYRHPVMCRRIIVRPFSSAARQPSNDFVEADGLIGRIAIVRVYRRALAAGEIREFRNRPCPVCHLLLPPPQNPCGLGRAAREKWDYYYYPPRIGGTGGTGWPSNARQAFDGYPTDISQPYRRNYWRSELKADQPAEVTIAYPKPVEVTQYVHYFIEPAAWKQADVLTSADGETWEPLQGFAGLPPENPQVLRIDRPRDARFYRIVVRSLHGGAQEVMAHEIETYYGVGEGGPHIETRPRPTAARPTATPQPTSSKATAPLATCEWSAALTQGLSLRFLAADGGIVDGVLSVLVNDHPAPITPIGGQEDRPLFAATVPNGALDDGVRAGVGLG